MNIKAAIVLVTEYSLSKSHWEVTVNQDPSHYKLQAVNEWMNEDFVCIYVSFGQGSSLLWTHTLRPFYSKPIALTQEGRSLVNDVCEYVRDWRVRRGE